MDRDVSVMFCISGSLQDLVPQANTAVVLDTAYNRKPVLGFESQIESVWESSKKDNPSLFNGTKFRLHMIDYRTNLLIFHLGITCYRDFIGTNWSPSAGDIAEYGRKHFNDSQACMSDAMGVGSFLLTSDSKVVFLKRSKLCGEAKGLWDVPGGHAEPQEIVGKIPFEEIDISKMDKDKVVEEIYDSVVREVVDEVNIPRSCLSEPVLIGVARNNTSTGRPSAEFFISCSLSSVEVQEFYNKGNQDEAYESTNIQFIPLDTLLQMEQSDDFWHLMAPSAKGCVTLYKLIGTTK